MFFLVDCGGLEPIISFLHAILDLLRIMVPIGLILIGSVDLGRAVLAGKEDEIKSHQKILLRRAVAAIMVFFVTTLVMFLMGLVKTEGGLSFKECWEGKATTDKTEKTE